MIFPMLLRRPLLTVALLVSSVVQAAAPKADSPELAELRRAALEAEASGSRGRSIKAWQRLLEVAPHDWRGQLGLGHQFLRVGNSTGAVEHLSAALAQPRPDATADDTLRLTVDLACAKSRVSAYPEAVAFRKQAKALGATDEQFEECSYRSDPDEGKARVLATLERTQCFGDCPVYSVVVRADGVVEWSGRKHVAHVGPAKGQLTPAQVEALKKLFVDAKFLDLKGDPECFDATDAPSAITSFDDGRRQRTVRHYYGCRSADPKLTPLEAGFDALVSKPWLE